MWSTNGSPTRLPGTPGTDRSRPTESVLRRNPFSNPFLFLATATALSIHVAALYLPPTQYVLRVEPIELGAWLRIVAVATSILIAMELHKALRRRGPGSTAAASASGRSQPADGSGRGRTGG